MRNHEILPSPEQLPLLATGSHQRRHSSTTRKCSQFLYITIYFYYTVLALNVLSKLTTYRITFSFNVVCRKIVHRGKNFIAREIGLHSHNRIAVNSGQLQHSCDCQHCFKTSRDQLIRLTALCRRQSVNEDVTTTNEHDLLPSLQMRRLSGLLFVHSLASHKPRRTLLPCLCEARMLGCRQRIGCCCCCRITHHARPRLTLLLRGGGLVAGLSNMLGWPQACQTTNDGVRRQLKKNSLCHQ